MAEKNEQALREHGEWLRVTLASIGDAVITTDGDANVTFLNRVAESLTGWTTAEAAGQPLTTIFNIVNEVTRQPVENTALRALRDGVVVGLANHTLLIAKDGSERPIDDSAAPIRNASGDVAGVVLVFRDISERKQQEKLVADARAYAENIIGTLRHALLVLDSNLHVVTANCAFYSLFHVAAGETEGRSIFALGNGQWNIPRLRELLESILSQHQVFEDYEVEQQFETIGRKVMALSARRIQRPGNHSELILLVIEDITERKATEQARKLAEQLLQASLANAQQLNRLATEMAQPGEPQEFFERLVDAAVEIMRSDYASMQIFEPTRGDHGELLLLAQRGFSAEGIDHWKRVSAHSGSICGEALRTQARCHVADVEQCEFIQGDDRASYLNMGMHSAQTTPLIARSGELLGMISTHWKQPHQPSERDFRMFDALAQYGSDLLERIRAEQVAARLAAIVTSSDDAIISKDLDGIITSWNKGAEKLFGYSAAEAVGKSVTILIPDDHLDEEPQILARIRRGESIEHYETIRRHKDGSRLDISLTVSPIRDAAGRVIGASKVARDISERKRLEDAMQKSEIRYRRLFEAAKDGILILDAQHGRITDANPFMEQLLGYPKDELLGKELWEIGLLQDASESQTMVRELQEQRFVRYEHLPLETRAGRQVEVEVVANVYQEDHAPVIQCNIRDITERSLLEQTTKEQAKSLADLSRRKDEFLAMLSHELRNPLAPIMNAVHLLRLQKGGTELQHEAHEMIDRQVAHLARLVDDLLEVSRISTGRIHLQEERIDLRGIVERAIETTRPQSGQKGQSVAKFLPEVPVWVYADPLRMEQVAVNLLNNASKYSDRGGHIWIGLEQQGDEAVLRVRDNGIGIAPELLPRIFDLFTQADKSLDRSQGGLGIGLSLVQSLVAMHRGRVEALSTVGQGSEFVVKLPIMSAPEASLSVPAEIAVRPARSLKVLVVDDNVDAAKGMAMLLRVSGHEVRVAHDGASAMQAALEFVPQVALLDIGLPVMDGFQVARWIRQEPAIRDAVLVASTGYGQESDRRRSRESGFDHHLVKPVDFAKVEKILADVAEGNG